MDDAESLSAEHESRHAVRLDDIRTWKSNVRFECVYWSTYAEVPQALSHSLLTQLFLEVIGDSDLFGPCPHPQCATAEDSM
jgi:hypothetical protein